ncbi:retrovirus-related Pol polyprotein from transposon 297 [Trichonephila clavipes]|nr:retrovirus-related Pol polyprotein from transposon 297 [Trichonephila clavipes]
MAGWYQKFIPHYADICEPLYRLKKREAKFKRSTEAQDAFNKVKQALTEAPVLQLPNFQEQFNLFTNASGVGIGAVLNQNHRSNAFASRTMNKAERNYTVTERECLAVIWAFNKFKTYFGSLPVKLGDEKPSHLLRKMKELSNGQLQDDFLQSLWLQRMPPHIQTVLSASSEPLDKLAIIADKVSEVVGASSTICAATTVLPPSQSSSCSVQPTMDSLVRQIQELSLQVAELTRERNSSRHQRYSSDRRRSHSRSRSVNRGSGICYYHRRYKEQARKCVSPCAFVQKKRVGSVIAGMAEPSQHTSRLFLLDRKSGQKFLIESGSEI